MTATQDIRSAFLDYFKSQKHKVMPSHPLVPSHDPTLMFTNAGMVAFKDVFTGELNRPGPRVATVQKCIRISGKHNDLENVGRTSRHHTFFEMLGNFSFGDYFKEGACRFGWSLLTEGFGLSPDRLWVTVFAGDEKAPADEEAERIWLDIGVPRERIARLGAKDNFWAMGDSGPCGPCSEIHFDRGEAFGPEDIENGERFFELWNLVFMQYMVRTPGAVMEPLPKPCIDTGAGLERIASVLQNVETNYDIDIFVPLVAEAKALAGKGSESTAEDLVSERVIADHARMTAFLIAEGVFPEKNGREYVLRRVMRRAIRHGHRMGIDDLFMHKVTGKVVEVMHGAYPELADRSELIEQICKQEEERFRATLGRGLDLLRETEDWASGPNGERMLPGQVAFDLTATYGFPKDLIEILGSEDGFIIDEPGYQKAEARHRAVSGAGKIGEDAVAPEYRALANVIGQTPFTGYGDSAADAEVVALMRDGQRTDDVNEGDQVEVVLASTPFYAESGGQVGDTGTLTAPGGVVTVQDAHVPVPGFRVHRGVVNRGSLAVGDKLHAAVDTERRLAIRRHHSATHLLHMALRELLGPHATQKGSRVDPNGLRFDFAHFEPVSAAQLADIEAAVARKVRENHPVRTDEISYDEARAKGAVALFGENYGDRVRMVTISDESVELCGGTHVSASGDIGDFFITGETGVAAGVRRIEAVAGERARGWIRDQLDILESTAGLLKVAPGGLAERAKTLMSRERELAKQVDDFKRKLAGGGRDLMDAVMEVEGVKVIGARLEVGDPKALRDTADMLRGKIGSGVVCLGGENNGKAALLVAVTKDLIPGLNAGQFIREIAELVGGRGGGRPDLAQAGGPDVTKIDMAVASIYDAVARERRK
jgi:alanyl-tRNA synthetase